MKRVLVISYYFLDETAVASVRINGLVKFLPRFGWEPVILTFAFPVKSSQNVRIIEVECEELITKWEKKFFLDTNESKKIKSNIKTHKVNTKCLNLLFRLWSEVFAYPDFVSNWRKPAFKLGNELINNEHFDAILSTSGPYTCSLIARDLKIQGDLPWVADFRDLWTQNHYYPYSNVRKYFEQKLELKTLSSADVLTVVSGPLAEDLGRLHSGKEVYVIPNGFDPSFLNAGTHLLEKFTITYTGVLYQGRRDPSPLFKALQELISEGLVDPEYISVRFYGPIESWIENDIDKYRLNDVVKLYGPITRKESISIQRQSHLLLLLTWNDPKELGVYTGKVFDYLAAQRPILSIGFAKGVVVDLLQVTMAGYHPLDFMELKKYILDVYLEFKFTGSIKYNGKLPEINKYNQVEMARKFSIILDKVVENKKLNR